MISNMQEFRVQDIALEMGDAPFGSNLKNTDYTEHGALVVQGRNVQGRSFDWTEKRHVSFEKWTSIPRSHCFPGDLVFPKVGTIGKVGILSPCEGHDKYILSTNTMKLKVDPKKANQVYVYYFFTWKKTVDLIHAMNSKSVQPVFNFTTLKSFPIELPPLEDQNRVAEILGALDDKIVINCQINQTLEQISLAVFKSWFVDFEPVKAKIEANAEGLDPECAAMCAISGKTNTEIDQLSPEQYQKLAAIAALFPNELVESESELIPKGWEVGRLGDITSYLNRGISPSYMEEGGALVLNQKCVRDNTIDFTQARRHDFLKKKIDDRELKVGDVLINSTGVGTLGRVAQVLHLPEKAIVDSHVTVARANERISWNFLGLALQRRQAEIEQLGEGSTGQTELNRTKLSVITTIIPPMSVIQAFDSITLPAREMFAQNHLQNLTLADTRDFLLPKLLSGELCVNGAVWDLLWNS